MADRRKLALIATEKALRLRQSLGVELQNSLCIYDIVNELGIEVLFVEMASLEGMYSANTRHILISSLRPPGRQAYTCAHELGHDVFNHGSHIDNQCGNSSHQRFFNVEECLADSFAGFFLMPRLAVSHAFAVRGWDMRSASGSQIYTISGWFGVGYTTLLLHMSRSLNLLSRSYADKLLKYTPKQIRFNLLGEDISATLLVVDTHWVGRPVDIQVGDYVLLPPHTFIEGDNVSVVQETASGILVEGKVPGIGRAYDSLSDWAVYLRVSRQFYVGRSIFRHLEDPDYE